MSMLLKYFTNVRLFLAFSDKMEEKSSDARKGSFPRKDSAVWAAMKKVKTKLSLTDEGATPVNWKCVFLVFISLVCYIIFYLTGM